VPLVLLERSQWAGFYGIYLVRFGFQNVGEILILKWFLQLKIPINSQKSVEDLVTLGPTAQFTLVFMKEQVKKNWQFLDWLFAHFNFWEPWLHTKTRSLGFFKSWLINAKNCPGNHWGQLLFLITTPNTAYNTRSNGTTFTHQDFNNGSFFFFFFPRLQFAHGK